MNKWKCELCSCPCVVETETEDTPLSCVEDRLHCNWESLGANSNEAVTHNFGSMWDNAARKNEANKKLNFGPNSVSNEIYGTGDIMEEIKNAVITSVKLSNDDHGCLTAWVQLDYGGTAQGFGGYALYLPESFKHHNQDSGAGHFIFRMLEVGGVSEWTKLVGKTVRVKSTHIGVSAIGHIIKDDWFCPNKDFGDE